MRNNKRIAGFFIILLISTIIVFFIFRITRSFTSNIYIQRPRNDALYVGGQLVILAAGFTNDINTITWFSNIDGELGVGREIDVNATELTEGAHTIVAEGTTLAGVVKSKPIVIRVARKRPVLPPGLSIAPTYFYIYRTTRDSADEHVRQVSLRNSGDGSINWVATSDSAWIVLSPTFGTTPSNINVRIDKSKLKFGGHQGWVTIKSVDGSIEETVDVKICLHEDEKTSSDCSNVFPVVID